MYGAILGDIIGSPYEFDMGDKSKDFPLFINRSEFTDDSVMTIAVCEALLRCKDNTNDFEDVIRTAVSLGGDCDTLTCIVGSMAEAFYGVPEKLKEECRGRISKDMLKVLMMFDEKIMGENHVI